MSGSTWHPPIPAGTLSSPAAARLGAALVLLARLYDTVERDGTIRISLSQVAPELGISYETVKRYWSAIVEADARWVRDVQIKGRGGIVAKLNPRYIDWHVLRANYPDQPETVSEVTPFPEMGSENGVTNSVRSDTISPPESETGSENGVRNGVTNSVNSDTIRSAYKVLMTPDSDLSLRESAAAPPPAPAPAHPRESHAPQETVQVRTRDPNQDAPACKLYKALVGIAPSRTAADMIANGYARNGTRRPAVTDLDRWREVVQTWTAGGKNRQNLDGMLDWYHEPARMATATAPRQQQTRQEARHADPRPVLTDPFRDPESGFVWRTYASAD